MTTRIRFSRNLKALRLAHGHSQEDMSLTLGCKRSSYSGYENGYTEPNLELLARIQAHYRVGADALLLGDLYALSPTELRTLPQRCPPRGILVRAVKEETAGVE